MAAKGDTFTSIGPDWYNVYKKEDGRVIVKPCPGVMTFSRERYEGYLTYIDTFSGYVQFKENGEYSLASSYAPYIGTFHIPDFHELDDETFKHRYVESISSLGWVIE
jgi:hypothetical protein